MRFTSFPFAFPLLFPALVVRLPVAQLSGARPAKLSNFPALFSTFLSAMFLFSFVTLSTRDFPILGTTRLCPVVAYATLARMARTSSSTIFAKLLRRFPAASGHAPQRTLPAGPNVLPSCSVILKCTLASASTCFDATSTCRTCWSSTNVHGVWWKRDETKSIRPLEGASFFSREAAIHVFARQGMGSTSLGGKDAITNENQRQGRRAQHKGTYPRANANEARATTSQSTVPHDQASSSKEKGGFA